MCSLTESALDPALREEKLAPGDRMICKKCRTNPPVVNLRVRDTYCKDCFLLAVHHKFRASLGKHKATRPGDKIGVCYSGGVGSNSLLHLIYDGINSDHKKLLFVPMVLHVDEGGLEGRKQEDRVEDVVRVRQMANKFGFQFYFCLLEDYMKEEVKVFGEEEKLIVEDKAVEDLQKLFLSVGENSGKEDLLVSLRRSVLVKAGRTLGCSKLFSGENGTSLAVDLLAGVSSGRGAGLPHLTGFRDTRDDVVVMRPMRDISSKEVALYSQFHNLDSEVRETLGTKESGLYSIRKLTEEFVTELQADFPSTVPTIFRTGDKLVAQENQEEEEGCVLCGGPMDTDCPVTCAFQATKWSQLVSEKGKPGLDDVILEVGRMENITVEEMDRMKDSGKPKSAKKSSVECGSGGGDCCGSGCGSKGGKEATAPSVKQVEREMCYSCRLVVRKVKQADALPEQVLKEVMVRNRRRDMEAEIHDFLLE